ncbi:MAG: sigma-54-dependent Fis family transcriptional regulator [Alphaproteobacteria bacterium]|nr:sigma-54-dependent Fis family transcriptional regulator [Alphaproteobacteria bacterium]
MTKPLAEGLAELGAATDVPGFIDGVLALVQAATGADIAYMAAGAGSASMEPRWSRCAPPDARDEVLGTLSTGLMQQSLARGETVLTPSALLDPRFMDRSSVRRKRIETVLCVPIGAPAVGLLYLHSRARGPFGPEDRALVEKAAALVAPALTALVSRHRLDAPDATRALRRTLRADRLVGTSPALAEVLARLQVCAKTRAPVLLTGQTGTGKSTVARVLHESSGRRGDFVTAECTQLRAERLVADLFGARAGSYTGIQRDTPGLVERARNGTLFLDEVGELSLDAQGQLLRFLQDRTYRWLGEARDRIAEDVRVIAATNVDLEAAVAAGTFRQDLYFRLAVFPVALPGLADRLDDLPFLAHDLVWRAADELGVPALPVSATALAHLDAREWPGNLRELDNVLRGGLLWAASEGAASIRGDHLDRVARPPSRPAESLHDAVLAFKRRRVLQALEAEGGNRTRAAERLGIGRSSLYELFEALGLSGDPDA